MSVEYTAKEHIAQAIEELEGAKTAYRVAGAKTKAIHRVMTAIAELRQAYNEWEQETK